MEKSSICPEAITSISDCVSHLRVLKSAVETAKHSLNPDEIRSTQTELANFYLQTQEHHPTFPILTHELTDGEVRELHDALPADFWDRGQDQI